MIRFAGAMVVLGGLVGVCGTAHAYQSCTSGDVTRLAAFYVKIGGHLLTYAQPWITPCQETTAIGPVFIGKTPDKMIDCRFAVPAGHTQRFTTRYSVTNPGIGGYSPVARCSVVMD